MHCTALTLSQRSPASLLKTLREMEKLLLKSNFSFFHSVFYPSEELSDIFIKFEIVICKLFHFGRVQNLSFGKGLRKVQPSLSQDKQDVQLEAD